MRINIKTGLLCSWGSLGFYRGLNAYNYGYIETIPKERKANEPYMLMYTKALERSIIRLGSGLLGTVVYIHPIFLFLVVTKELYRLEVNVRGLEEEKKSDFYNRLLI